MSQVPELKIRLSLSYNRFKRLLWADSCGHDFNGFPKKNARETKEAYLTRCNTVDPSKGEAPFAGAEFLWNSWVTNVVKHTYYSGVHHFDKKTQAERYPWGTGDRDKKIFKTQILKNNGFLHTQGAQTQLNICESPPDGSYKIVSTLSGGLTNRKNMLCSIMSSVDRNDFSGDTNWACNLPDGAKEINPKRGMLLEFYDPQGGVYCQVRYSGNVQDPTVELFWHRKVYTGSSLSSAGEMTAEVKAICKKMKHLETEQKAPAVVAGLMKAPFISVAEFERDIEFAFLKKFMADNGQMWGTFIQHTDASGKYPICIDDGDFSGFLNWYYMIDGCTGIITNDPYASTLLPKCTLHKTDVHGTGWSRADAPWGVWSSKANAFKLPICVSITLEGSYYTTEDGREEIAMLKNDAREKFNTEKNGLFKLLTASTVVNAVQEQVDTKKKLGRIWLKIVPTGTPVEQNIKVKIVDISELGGHFSSITKNEVIEHLVNVVAHFHLRNSKSHTLTPQEIQTMGNHLPDEAQKSLSQLFANKLAAMGIAGKNNFKKKKPKKQTKKKPKKKPKKQPKKKPKKQPKKQTKKKPKKQT